MWCWVKHVTSPCCVSRSSLAAHLPCCAQASGAPIAAPPPHHCSSHIPKPCQDLAPACKMAKCCTSIHSALNIRQVQGTSQAHMGVNRILDQHHRQTDVPNYHSTNPKRTQEATHRAYRQLAWAPAQRQRAHGFWHLPPSCPEGPGRLCSSQNTLQGHQHLQQQCWKVMAVQVLTGSDCGTPDNERRIGMTTQPCKRFEFSAAVGAAKAALGCPRLHVGLSPAHAPQCFFMLTSAEGRAVAVAHKINVQAIL